MRDRSTTPDESIIRIETPGGSIEYAVPILKVKKYTAEDLFAKNLLFLLPFHIFKYEERFDIIIKDNAAYENLFKHFADIRSRLDYMGESGKLSEFDKQAVIDMSKKVIRALGAKHGKISEVSNAMGGVVLDFEAKRIFNEGRESKSVEVIDKLIAKDGLSVEEACDKLDYSADDYYAYKAKNHDTIIRDNTR